MRIVILGGGISGLSLAWWLHRQCDVVVLEKESVAGGWLKTERKDYQFDLGPRSLRAPLGHPLRDLIQELDIEKEMIFSSAKKRYLLQKGKLVPVSKWKWIPSLLKEWSIPYQEEEETIADFAQRRFNKEMAETFFDAMALGVYAGDMHELSMNASFPKIKEWEKHYGSLARGILKERFKLNKLFSFKEGVGFLCQKLCHALGNRVFLNEQVDQVTCQSNRVIVTTQKGQYEADYVVSALPPSVLAHYFPKINLSFLKTVSLNIVSCGFDRQVLPISGFGYLVPSREKESLLGMLFDSEIFPQHNQKKDETRLTMMVRAGADPRQVCCTVLKRHLKVGVTPNSLSVREAKEAIPQYRMGHEAEVKGLREQVAHFYPRLFLVGNYLSGVSIADCMATSKDLSEYLLKIDTR